MPSRAAVFGALAAIDATRQSTLEQAQGVGSERRQAKRTFEYAGGATASAVSASSAELAAGGGGVGEVEERVISTAGHGDSADAVSSWV